MRRVRLSLVGRPVALLLIIATAFVAAPEGVRAQGIKGIERGGGFDRPYVPPRKRMDTRVVSPRTRQPIRRPDRTPEPTGNPTVAPVVDVSSDALEHYELGRTAYDRGEFNTAVREFEKAIAADSKYIDALIDLGDAYFDSSQLDEAVQTYRRALVVDSSNVDAQYRLGRAAFARYDFDTARTSYEAVIKRNPSDPQAVYNLALTYKALKRYDQAIPYFEQAISLRAGGAFPEARLNLARSLYEQNRLDESIASASKAIEELGPDSPDSANAHYAIATALAKKADLPGATESLKKAIAVCDGCTKDLLTKFYLPLAQIYEARGERADAANAYEQVLNLAPFLPPDQIQEIRSRISRLRSQAM
jgi:tetratricopeptide (TPR) repeat protein